ncbi:MAG: chitobiase/beta-hexosaminidase C-terminal domain-containing protein [Bacteroidales bacterium]|nr:chitobiase/beta-hexosaminidase C-terminal domain-containing protein [Bacteroidales bacterium]
MRKNLRIFATAIAFVCVAASAQTSWVETPYANLTTGDIVVIADTASKTAIINTNGSGKAPVAEAITLGENNSTITSSVDASLQWVVTVEDGTYKFNVEGTNNYLYSTNSNNGLRVGKSENNVFTIFASGDSVYLVNSATNRYVGVYFNGDEPQDWRSYTSIHKNIKSTRTAFYKKVVEGVVVAAPQLSASATYFTENATVTITAEEGADIYYTTNGDEPTTASAKYEAPVVVDATATVKAIAAKGETTSEVRSVSVTKIQECTISEFKALEKNTVAVLNLNGATINYIYAPANKTPEIFVADENCVGLDLYMAEFPTSKFKVGDKLSGKIMAMYKPYNAKNEAVDVDGTDYSVLSATEGTATAIEVTVADVKADKYKEAYVTITGYVKKGSDDKYYIVDKFEDEAAGVQLYDGFKLGYTAAETASNEKATVTGVFYYFNETPEIVPTVELSTVTVEIEPEPAPEPVATPVVNIKADQLDVNAPIYNLQGQRVDKNAKGILIQNGKKILVK